MLFVIQILSYILNYITSKKILSFSFCEYKLPYIFRILFSNIITVNSPCVGDLEEDVKAVDLGGPSGPSSLNLNKPIEVDVHTNFHQQNLQDERLILNKHLQDQPP